MFQYIVKLEDLNIGVLVQVKEKDKILESSIRILDEQHNITLCQTDHYLEAKHELLQATYTVDGSNAPEQGVLFLRKKLPIR